MSMEQNENTEHDLEIVFPSDGDYIPAVRKFVAEAALIQGFSQKFSYRSEIIIDELANNAVKFGPKSKDAVITLGCTFTEDSLRLKVRDRGGSQDEVTNLRKSIDNRDSMNFMGHGLEIVKMLASSVDMQSYDNGETVVRVVKQRSMNYIDTIAE